MAPLVVLAIGILLCGAGLVLLINLFGAADAAIARVTSRSLGDLAPGFAASRTGFRVYAVLVLAVGIAVTALALEILFVVALAVLVFVAASVIAIAGEVRTYRELKR
ncbi:MAG TPA: hypothetical protein VGK42_07400 [Candidatus Dormibacteraeota bacterium]